LIDANPVEAQAPVAQRTTESAAAARRQVLERYGALPLGFEANEGQSDAQVKFLSRGRGYSLFLTASEAVLVLGGQGEDPAEKGGGGVLRMKIMGGNPAPAVIGLNELPGRTNYFIGNGPDSWRREVRSYARVQYRDVYSGVDLVYYGHRRDLEYDFVLRPGADPGQIVLGFEGSQRLDVDPLGDLVLHTAVGAVRQRRPVIYQEVDGGRREIPGGYVIRAGDRVGFQVGGYDTTRPLIIDPVLVYSTLLGGGANDRSFGIAVDAAGNTYLTGQTLSSGFPTAPGAFGPVHNGGSDAFVTKLDATGSALVYSTYLGGSSDDTAFGIAVDAAGKAYVTGRTASVDFPTTAGAFDPGYNGGGSDAFVTSLDPTGSVLSYSTYLGGSGFDQGIALDLDAARRVFVTGRTRSADFQTTPGAFDTSLNGVEDIFVTTLDPSGSILVYSTYLGGDDDALPGGREIGVGIKVDASGTYVVGDTGSANFPTTPGALDPTFNGGAGAFGDAFVTKLDPTGSVLLYSTYLGGSGADSCQGMTLASGHVYVSGSTLSADFPTTPGAFDTGFNGSGVFGDIFVARLNPTGTSLMYSTYLGGIAADANPRIAVDGSGSAYVTGETRSFDFPITPTATQPFLAGAIDAFLAKLSPNGSTLAYSTYLGGFDDDAGNAIVVDASGSVYVTGRTASPDFPTTAGAFDTAYNGGISDAFVLKFAPLPAEQIAGLEDLITDLGLPQGIETSLLAKLTAAANALAGGNTTVTCNNLQALINQAQAQSGNNLTAEQSAAIVAAAEAIRAALGCS
jgi:hypothetical protein